MQYITTFDATFAFFAALTVVSIVIPLLGLLNAKKHNKQAEFSLRMRRINICMNFAWLAMLVVSGFQHPAGTTTFLFWAAIGGAITAVVMIYFDNLRIKRMVKDSLEQAEDLLGLGS